LNPTELHDLHCLSLELKRPMTRLVAEAVRAFVAAESARVAVLATRCAEVTTINETDTARKPHPKESGYV